MTTAAPKPSFFKSLTPIFVILGLVLMSLYAVRWKMGGTRSHDTKEVLAGAVLEDFSLTKLNGEVIHASQLQGQVFLINFWATWCQACMVEMPSLVKLREQYHSRGFEILGINVDENPQAVVPKIVKKLGIGFPIFIDATDGALSAMFDVHAIPMTVVINKARKVLHVENGERDWFASDVRDQLDKWLKDK